VNSSCDWCSGRICCYTTRIAKVIEGGEEDNRRTSFMERRTDAAMWYEPGLNQTKVDTAMPRGSTRTVVLSS